MQYGIISTGTCNLCLKPIILFDLCQISENFSEKKYTIKKMPASAQKNTQKKEKIVTNKNIN
jgi:hypothetical protein